MRHREVGEIRTRIDSGVSGFTPGPAGELLRGGRDVYSVNRGRGGDPVCVW